MSGESEVWAAEEFPHAVAGRLRITRKRLGWTLAQAVEHIANGMNESQLCRVEMGQRPLRLQPLWEISTSYGLTVVKVITDAAATVVGPTSPLPCFACKGTGLASRPPEPQWVQPPTLLQDSRITEATPSTSSSQVDVRRRSAGAGNTPRPPASAGPHWSRP